MLLIAVQDYLIGRLLYFIFVIRVLLCMIAELLNRDPAVRSPRCCTDFAGPRSHWPSNQFDATPYNGFNVDGTGTPKLPFQMGNPLLNRRLGIVYSPSTFKI